MPDTAPTAPTATAPGGAGTLVAAVDVGGTTLKGALVGVDGSLGHVIRVPTPTDGDEAVAATAALVRQLAGTGPAVAFGVCTPGIVDPAAGVVRDATNLGWREVPLVDRVREASGLTGVVAHDMRAAGIAEWRLGAARGATDFAFVALGTGISAALVVDGHLLSAAGYAGELGHTPVPGARGIPCTCGASGCLETVASARGVRETAARLHGITPEEESPTQLLAELARDGDPTARAAFDLAAQALAESFAALVTVLAPERIVVGGGLSGAFDLIADPVRQTLAGLPFQRRTEVVLAELGPDAGLVGAGLAGAEHAGVLAPLGEGGLP